jgi:hypothetical protein
MKVELNSESPSGFEEVHRFDHCEVILWKDGTVTIASLDEPQVPVLTLRRAPNLYCSRD